AQFLRDYPPAGVAQPRFERALDAIESPCSRRDELALREVYSREMESDEAKSKALVDEVERLGLEPFQAPAPLPPISPAEIHMICWMALEQNIDK
ncbi:MAG TPA: hypothetical protein PK867_02235, partial [Pirellulales bacterium]|nr:hypothetical protein [Pirellulales bacterium]